ncbi:MAG: hypothetical protein L0I29_12705 [Hyphomicrobiales bacterium]|nr:hypothetical protein [Hyphomicrobiales bacterium]
MRKATVGVAAAWMLALAVPSFAAGPRNDANSATSKMSDSVQQTPNTGGVAPADSGAGERQSPLDAAVAGIRASEEGAVRVQSMKKVASLRIVDVGAGSDRTAIDKAVAENRSGVKALRNAIRANNPLQGKLGEESIRPEQVVAVKLNDDGSLTVYVEKPA